jgi:predicted metalloprotease with PDZ domain
MKKTTWYLFSLLLFFPHSSNAASIQYDISLEKRDNQTNQLIITTTFKGNPQGITYLRLPNLYPSSTLHYAINPYSDTCTVNRTEDDNIYKVTHQPDELFYVSTYYALPMNKVKMVRMPIIGDNYFAAQGYNILSTISKEPSDTIWEVQLNFSAENEEYICFKEQCDNKKIVFNATMDELRDDFIIGGNIKYDEFIFDNHPTKIIANYELSQDADDFKLKITQLLTTHRNFWQDHNFPNYNIMLLKLNDHEVGPYHKKTLTGTHTNGTTAIAYSTTEDNLFSDPQKHSKFMCAYSHELGHAWFGNKMLFPIPQGDIQWFFEGFNDYYGLLLAYKAKIIDYAQYLAIYNKILTKYYLSPVKTATNQQIFDNFDSDSIFYNITMSRGHILAQELLLLSHQHNFKYNILDHFIRDLIHSVNLNSEKLLLTKDDFFKKIENYFPHDMQRYIRDTVIDGKPITVSANALGHCARLIETKMLAPIYGFDINEFLFNQTIVNLDSNSNAYQAGLREGDQVVDYSFNFSNLEQEVIVTTTQGDIHFYFDAQKITVPQFELINQESPQSCINHWGFDEI